MDERTKQRVLLAVVAFNITVIGFQLLFNFGDAFTWTRALIGFACGLVAAGVGYGIGMTLYR